MFDEILQMVKEHLGNDAAVTSAIPADQADAIHTEIANHIHNGLQNQAPATGGLGGSVGGILSQLENSLASGNLATSAISGGLVSSLASKFGLSPAITGAIAASLPGLMQKFVSRSNAGPAPAAS
jgi:hypothetical protein